MPPAAALIAFVAGTIPATPLEQGGGTLRRSETVTPAFSARRMLKQYVERFYVKAAAAAAPGVEATRRPAA